MSTFLHSAAMSLLSRTLQTLLSKYLSDVDVEGIALPSLGGGDAAGWGVRLSNVKLRNGLFLYELPGQYPPPKQDEEPHSKRQQEQQTNDNRTTHKGAPTQRTCNPKSKRASRKGATAAAASATNAKQNVRNHPRRKKHPGSNDKTDDDYDDTVSESTIAVSDSQRPPRLPQQQQPSPEDARSGDSPHRPETPRSRSRHSSRTAAAASIPTVNNNHASELGSATTAASRYWEPSSPPPHPHNSEEPRQPPPHVHPPPDPPPLPKSWLFSSSWFYPASASTSSSSTAPSTTTNTRNTTHSPSIIPTTAAAEGGPKRSDSNNHPYHPRDDPWTGTHSVPAGNAGDNHERHHQSYKKDDPEETAASSVGPTIDTDGDESNGGYETEDLEDTDSQQDNEEEEDGDDDSDEECLDDDDDYDEEDENDGHGIDDETLSPMMLRLGSGGTIGTLDVRLVGKTVHVLVEDAALTIEVVRGTKRSASNNSNSNDTRHQSKHPISSPLHDSNSQPQRPSTSKPTIDSNSTLKETKTTGDRVLAENALARIFSILPNLFLRDVRVRLVIRDDEDSPGEAGSAGEDDPDSASDDGGSDGLSTTYNSNDTVIEVSIELLSINDGKDFLLNFGGTSKDEDEESSDEETLDERTAGVNGFASSSMASGLETTNEFITKRIRTGRGPDGGIVIRMFQAGDDLDYRKHAVTPLSWARESWNASTGLVIMRCSGLDLQAKIFMGTKKEIALSNNGYFNDEFDGDEYVEDTMLFVGMDYIVPGPKPPLPRITPMSTLGPTNEEDDTWANLRAVAFSADTSGIQSCRIPSPFHKVARGLVPRHCDGEHLPCEMCHQCWTKNSGSVRPHKLDLSTPIGGLTFHASIRDPLEINLDRYNLAVMGLLLHLLSKKQTTNDQRELSGHINDISSAHGGSQRPSNGKYEKPVTDDVAPSLDESSRSALGVSQRTFRGRPLATKTYNEFDVSSSYPSYMQPEKIQMIGVHLAEVKVRLHVLRSRCENEGGRSYGYWDLLAKCSTVDFQQLIAKERPFLDVRFDVGHLLVAELKGVERKQIVELGVQQQTVDDSDDISVETFLTVERNHKRSPWPTTAAAILELSPPLESLVYADREHHGLQLRYVSVSETFADNNRSRKDANLRLGPASVDVKFAIKDDIQQMVAEARSTLFGPPNRKRPPKVLAKSTQNILLYKMISEGVRLQMEPMIDAHLPSTTIQGEISSLAGFSLKVLLDRFHVGYRRPSPVRALDQGLSLVQMSKLPDTVRLRILLFLKDLKPFEAALGLPESSNAFLRCRAVNKGILQVARRNEEHNADDRDLILVHASDSVYRKELMAKLAMLDNDTLAQVIESLEGSEQAKSSHAFKFL